MRTPEIAISGVGRVPRIMAQSATASVSAHDVCSPSGHCLRDEIAEIPLKIGVGSCTVKTTFLETLARRYNLGDRRHRGTK